MILFVDDELRYVDSYAEELKMEGFELSPHESVDSAVRFFDQSRDQVELLILDIMMPPGTVFKDVDTEGGLRTGLAFYRHVRERAAKLPVFILTNVSDPAVDERFQGEDNCWFFRKDQCLPFELAEHVKKLLGKGLGASGNGGEHAKS
jgi:DNA-binding response OmpR family regulator